MRWHVICYLWLMLLTDANCNQTLKAPELRRSVRLDEVSDFADVIEPLQNQADSSNEKDGTLGPTRRDVKSSIFKRYSYLQNEFKGTDDYNYNADNLDQTRQDRANDFNAEINNKNEFDTNRHNVPKKYSNLLDLKYYYARGLPLNKKYPRLRKRNIAPSSYDRKEESKRSAVNILPVMSDHNPYMSNLADATNDAYLKMRNYAATLMVILTTPKPPIAPPRRLEAEPAVYHTPSAKFFVGNEKKKLKFNRFNSFNNNDGSPRPLGSNFLKRKMYSNQELKKKKAKTKVGEAYDMIPSSVDDLLKYDKSKKDVPSDTETNYKFYRPLITPPQISEVTDKSSMNLYKITADADSPYSWENNILDEVNVKVKKSARLPKAAKGDEETVLEKEPKGGGHVNATNAEKQSPTELESRVITGQTSNASDTTSCTINKLPESEEDNCEESEEEEDEECASNQPANNACLDTFQKFNRTKRQIGKDVTNSSQTVVKVQSGEDSSANQNKNVDPDTECPKFFTIPSETLKDNMHKAIENVNVPETKPEDFKKFKPSKSSKEYSQTIETSETKAPPPQTSKQPERTTEAKHPSTSKVTASKTKASESAKLTNLKAATNTKLTHTKTVVNSKPGIVELKESKHLKGAAAFGGQNQHKFAPAKTSSASAVKVPPPLGPELKTQQTQNVKTMETVKTSNSSTVGKTGGESDSCVEEYMTDSNSTKMQEVKKLTDPSNYPATHKSRKVKKDVSSVEGSKDLENSKDLDEGVLRRENDQLRRLQRDMYVINELQELLDTVRAETKQNYDFDTTRRKRQSDGTENGEHIGNFYNHQNSQYNKQLRHYNLVSSRRHGDFSLRAGGQSESKGKEKRFLFKKKRKRKKKKSQTIWKHLFGAHDDNRFLNQNFPNSQYAIYPN